MPELEFMPDEELLPVPEEPCDSVEVDVESWTPEPRVLVLLSSLDDPILNFIIFFFGLFWRGLYRTG